MPFPKVCHFQSCVNLALSSRLLPPYSVFHLPVVIVPFLWVRLYNSIFNVWLIFCRHQNVYLLCLLAMIFSDTSFIVNMCGVEPLQEPKEVKKYRFLKSEELLVSVHFVI